MSGPSTSLSGVMYNMSAGLGWNFVPPYGPWSTITCADCHMGSDVANDPAGPHGSDNPWLLRGIDFNARVDNNLNGSLDDTVDRINSGSWSQTTNICYSCHRRDVYGVKTADESETREPRLPSGARDHMDYSRSEEHPFETDSEGLVKNAFGIWCMNCHGGDSIGGIHGSNRGRGSQGSSPVGLRLRNGGAVIGNTIGSSEGRCFTKEFRDSVNTCDEGHDGEDYSTHYNYTQTD